MKGLIAGSSGFIGKNLTEYLDTYSDSNYNYITRSDLNSDFQISSDIYFVVNLIGKAHDTDANTDSKEFYKINTEISNRIYEKFLSSNATVFISISSIKAVSDVGSINLTEDVFPDPKTHYGKSKLLAERYIIEKGIPHGKRVYILRPCMVHGPNNKGNLNLLYKFISKGFPWPLGAFENERSFCSIENLCFVINELLYRQDIPSGIYNVSDDDPISTNDLVALIASFQRVRIKQIKLNVFLVKSFAFIGDLFNLSFNSDRLNKLTGNFVVNSSKLKSALGKPLPVSSKEGLIHTLKSFRIDD